MTELEKAKGANSTTTPSANGQRTLDNHRCPRVAPQNTCMRNRRRYELFYCLHIIKVASLTAASLVLLLLLSSLSRHIFFYRSLRHLCKGRPPLSVVSGDYRASMIITQHLEGERIESKRGSKTSPTPKTWLAQNGLTFDLVAKHLPLPWEAKQGVHLDWCAPPRPP